jgi:NhaA family Na+:H+ antiporter
MKIAPNNKKLVMTNTIRRFIQMEASGGVVMIVAMIFALLWANSPWHHIYDLFSHVPIHMGIGILKISPQLDILIKDGLMVAFFLLTGLELKRELCEGALSNKSNIILPTVAAIGGMALPSLIYAFINIQNPDYLRGWAIPAATDIAFALCILTLVARNIPATIKILLLTIAIVDDIGAIIIIALFYTSDLRFIWLLISAILCLGLYSANRFGVMKSPLYLILCASLACTLHIAGIHSTIAGVIAGLSVPMRHPSRQDYSPVSILIHRLHPWVAFGILPLFALVSSGIRLIDIQLSDLTHPIALGVSLGLAVGKPLGIILAIFIATKISPIRLPERTEWHHIIGIGCLAGIGFTMSLFISSLAFKDLHLQNAAKTGILLGSILSSFLGAAIFKFYHRKH